MRAQRVLLGSTNTSSISQAPPPALRGELGQKGSSGTGCRPLSVIVARIRGRRVQLSLVVGSPAVSAWAAAAAESSVGAAARVAGAPRRPMAMVAAAAPTPRARALI